MKSLGWFTVGAVVLALWLVFPFIMGYTFLFFDRNLWQPTMIASSALIALLLFVTVATKRRYRRELRLGFAVFIVTAALYVLLAPPPGDPLSLVNIFREGFLTLVVSFVTFQVIDGLLTHGKS